jgi:hypothetical protein
MAQGKVWELPADLDPECRALCVALNKLPGIETYGSCCGHGRTPFFILFIAKRLTALPAVVHATEIGWLQSEWRVKAVSRIDVSKVNFVLEGPIGGYRDAAAIAADIEAGIRPRRRRETAQVAR